MQFREYRRPGRADYSIFGDRLRNNWQTHRVYKGYKPSFRDILPFAVATMGKYVRPGVPSKANRFKNLRMGPFSVIRKRRSSSRRRISTIGTRSGFGRSRRSVSRRRVRSSVVRRVGRRGARGKSRGKSSTANLMKFLYNHIATPLVYKQTIAGSYSGQQGIRSWASQPIGSTTDLIALQSQRPQRNLTVIGGTLTEIGKNNGRIRIKNFVKRYALQNRSNIIMRLKVYECLCRRDVGSSIITFDANGASNVFNNDDALANNLGANQVAFNTGITHSSQLPGYTPYMSSQWCQYFKILKCTPMSLGPNEIRPYVVRQSAKELNMDYIDATSENLLRGWSKVLIFSWVGQMVDAGGAPPPTAISYGACDLHWTYEFESRFEFPPTVGPHYNIDAGTNAVSGIPNSIFSGTLTPGFTAKAPVTTVIETVSAAMDVTEVTE
jgi:hypothetical protein